MPDFKETEIASLRDELKRRDIVIAEKDDEIKRGRNALNELMNSLPCVNNCSDCKTKETICLLKVV